MFVFSNDIFLLQKLLDNLQKSRLWNTQDINMGVTRGDRMFAVTLYLLSTVLLCLTSHRNCSFKYWLQFWLADLILKLFAIQQHFKEYNNKTTCIINSSIYNFVLSLFATVDDYVSSRLRVNHNTQDRDVFSWTHTVQPRVRCLAVIPRQLQKRSRTHHATLDPRVDSAVAFSTWPQHTAKSQFHN